MLLFRDGGGSGEAPQPINCEDPSRLDRPPGPMPPLNDSAARQHHAHKSHTAVGLVAIMPAERQVAALGPERGQREPAQGARALR